MTAATESHQFQVLVAGGGVGGLTLVNALQKANIDCLLLEARDDILPKIGASIAVFANGSRILDQLGVYDDVVKQSEEVALIESWMDGELIDSNEDLKITVARHGYGLRPLLRYDFLKTLYDHIPDRSKLLTGKHVTRVDHYEHGVIAQCKDGTSYSGDIIVGADGVHSLVREEMWRHANLAQPGQISVAQQSLMKSEYRCLWTVSNPIDGLRPGVVYRTYGKDTSFLMLTGKDGQPYLFVFDKLDKTYHVPHIPKYTQEDSEALISKHLHTKLTESITVEDVWNRRIFSAMTPLEEALYDTWTWGRIACIGDSVHKMTPNIGQGGNNAVETAAALANAIHELFAKHRASSSKPTLAEITTTLSSYHSRREPRLKTIYTIANKVTRFEAFAGPVERLMALYIFPRLSWLILQKQSKAIAGAERLEFLPEPERAKKATWAYEHNGQPTEHAALALEKRTLALSALLIVVGCLILRVSRHAGGGWR